MEKIKCAIFLLILYVYILFLIFLFVFIYIYRILYFLFFKTGNLEENVSNIFWNVLFCFDFSIIIIIIQAENP